MRKCRRKMPPRGVIFRAWITGKNGERLYAKDYGLKAWPLNIRNPREKQ